MRKDEKKKKGADWLTIADDSIFFPEHSVHAATYFEQSGATHCREGKKNSPPSSFLHLRWKNNSSPSLIACQRLI